MKSKLCIMIILIIFISSCYQAHELSTGSVSIKLHSDVMKDAPAGFDGELRLAIFPSGDIDSLIDSSGPGIKYLGDFPTPILANNSVPFNGNSGVLSLLNVPSDKDLSILIEHYEEEYYPPSESDYYYMTYAGLSDSFKVPGGGSTEAAITLDRTEFGVISIDLSSYLPDQVNIEIIETQTYNTYFTVTGSLIQYNPGSFPIIYSNSYGGEGVSYPVVIPMLPGKEMRIIATLDGNPIFTEGGDEEKVAVSDIFELQPGRTFDAEVYSFYRILELFD